MILGIEGAIVELWLLNCLMAYSAYLAMAGGSYSFAYVVFIGLGAYTAGILTTKSHFVLGEVILIAPALAAAVALLIARPLERLSGIYMAIASVSLVGLFQVLLVNLVGLTGGSLGIVAIPIVIGIWQVAVAVIVVALILRQLERSEIGRMIRMTRLDPLVASSLGVNVRRVRVWLFVASAMVGSVAGVLSAQYYGTVAPPTYGFELVVQLLAMVIIGGLGSWAGVPLGAAVFTLLPRWMEAFGVWSNLVTGLILLVIVVISREGITGAVRYWWFRKRRGAAVASSGEIVQARAEGRDPRGSERSNEGMGSNERLGNESLAPAPPGEASR